MYFRYLVIISPWKRVGAFIWTNLNSLHPRMHCAKFCWNRPSGSGEEYFLISSMYFFYLVIISPWKRAGSFIWTNLYPLHPRMHCVNWYGGSGEEDFLILSIFIIIIFFCYLVIISPWKRAGPFTWTNLNSNDPRLHCAKFGWNWPCASGEEDFLNFFNLFSLFGNYLLLEKGRALYFSKLESPSPKECFVPSLV